MPTSKSIIASQPFYMLLVMAVFVLIKYFVPSTQELDINMHDTFGVVYLINYYPFIVGICLVEWLIYMWRRQRLFSSQLTWLHVLLTILPLLYLILSWPLLPAPSVIFHFKPLLILSIVALPLAQLLFIANLLGALKRQD